MYFDTCKSLDEVKRRYKILSKRLHPDTGGDETLMKEINEEYDKKCKNFNFDFKPNHDFKRNWKRHSHKDEEDEQPSDYKEKILGILSWAEEHPSFDVEFLDSLLSKIEKGIILSPKQKKAVDNIIIKFKINLQEWL